MASKASSLTSTPPNVSASDTTPSLSNSHVFTRFDRLRRARIEAKPYDLGGSAPDIEHNRRAGVLVGEIADAGRGEMRLGLAVDNLELDAEPFANLGDKVWPIGGRAAGFGRDGARASDPTRRHLVPTDLQGFNRAGDRRLAQASRSATALRLSERCARTRR